MRFALLLVKMAIHLSIMSYAGRVNRDFSVFFVDGLLAENDGNTIHAYGRATVFLVHGLALVSFAINVQDVTSSSTSDFTFGIRPAKLSGLNSAIPVITPIAGGTCIYSYKGSGKTNLAGELNGNGGTMLTLNGNWQFARVYQNYPSTLVGGWPTSIFSTSINMSGLCFGRY